MRLLRSLGPSSLLALLKRFPSSRRNSVMPTLSDSNRPAGIPALLLPPTNLTDTDVDTSHRRTPHSLRAPLVSAVLVHGIEISPSLYLEKIDPDNSLDTEPEVELVIENSKYESSLFIPFDHREIQSPESPDNSHPQPRYNNMIFFDPKEKTKSSSDPKDQRRKKFLTVISANSISPHASPSSSPSKQTDISATVIQNTYQQSLIKMKFILIEIENSGYRKNEIIEACQYARQFKGIMNGEARVIEELRKNSALNDYEIEAKFERLKTISFLFQQKCSENNIFSGRDENSLKSEYKFADGRNNRPGLRLTYIPDEVLKMYKKHRHASPRQLSVKPAAARMSP